MDVIGGHLERSDDSARHQVQDIVGNGERVIAFLHYHAERPDGHVVDGLEAQVNRLSPDGSIAEVWTFLDEPEKFRNWGGDEAAQSEEVSA